MKYHEFIDSYADQYSQKFIANYQPDNPQLKDIVRDGLNTMVLIGPEGDFHESEIEVAISKGFKTVNLSENRLRTETAGLAALMQIV
jgi:16S rRNA (uracil1498-N3)-methyltransferase